MRTAPLPTVAPLAAYRSRRPSKGGLLVGLATAFAVVSVASIGCQANTEIEDDVGEVSQAVTARGNWSGFTGGQCVHGVYQFYEHRFGISLTGTCAQGGDIGNCANCGACMIWKSNAVRPDPKLFNRYAWGSVMPQTYDIVVYAPRSGRGPGHVACVDHMDSKSASDWQSLYVMDSNYFEYEKMASQVHTVSRASYGIYRLKSLEKKKAESCDRTTGDFTFSCDGPSKGKSCLSLAVPGGTSFGDNYLCSTYGMGLRWSSEGPISGMSCSHITEAAADKPAAWKDTYLCAPPQTVYAFSWSNSGAIAGKTCVQWNEPLAKSFGDDYLCFDKVTSFSNGGFTFSEKGEVAGKSCVNVREPGQPFWDDNYFCAPSDIGMKWSYKGPVDGMTCTNVVEPGAANAKDWQDNYLCLPSGSPYSFSWAYAGATKGKTCVRWFDHAETASPARWADNWLCIDKPTKTSEDVDVTDFDTNEQVTVEDDSDAQETNDATTGAPGASESTASPPDSADTTPASSPSGGCSTGGSRGKKTNDAFLLGLGLAAVTFATRRRSRR